MGSIKDDIINGLDKSTELSFHMHEFMHRALHTVPQLKKWIEKNKIKLTKIQ